MKRGFDPVYTENARALILGTVPSPKSVESGFYYGHKQNRFWKLMSRLTGDSVPETIEEKKDIIQNNGLALWDVIEDCSIEGASDASIKDVEPRDLSALICRTKVEAVFCNGAKSYEIYMKHLYPRTGIKAYKMPSTSPANAAWSLDRLEAEWSILKNYISVQK